MSDYDVILLGLGAMGSATLCELSRRGASVLGIDQFAPPHSSGSSHGQTRIIREAYHEHPSYVPIVQRAFELWVKLEAETGLKLITQTGGLMISRPEETVFKGAIESATQHQLSHETLTAAEVHSRFPALLPPPGMMAVHEPRAGILFPSECIAANLLIAAKHRAETRLNEKVLGWSVENDQVRVKTVSGEFTGRKLIISAGPWLPQLVPELASLLLVERQVLFWFNPRTSPEIFRPDRCPIHIWEFEPGRYFYGFPDLGKGVKIARHHYGLQTDPENVDRKVHLHEIEDIRDILGRYLPEANGQFVESAVCLYTNTPDGHFIIDFHPRHQNVLLLSPCSGHGFKFSCAVGEIAADLVQTGKSELNIDLFRLGRFDLQTAKPGS